MSDIDEKLKIIRQVTTGSDKARASLVALRKRWGFIDTSNTKPAAVRVKTMLAGVVEVWELRGPDDYELTGYEPLPAQTAPEPR